MYLLLLYFIGWLLMAFTPVAISSNAVYFGELALDRQLFYQGGRIWAVFLDKNLDRPEVWVSSDAGATWCEHDSGTLTDWANWAVMGVSLEGSQLAAIIQDSSTGYLELHRYQFNSTACGSGTLGWLSAGSTNLKSGPTPNTSSSLLPRKWSVFRVGNKYFILYRGADAGGLQRIYFATYTIDTDTWSGGTVIGSGGSESHALLGAVMAGGLIHIWLGTPTGDILHQSLDTSDSSLGTLQTVATAALEELPATGQTGSIGAPTVYYDETEGADVVALPYYDASNGVSVVVATSVVDPTWSVEQVADSNYYNSGVLGNRVATIAAVEFGTPNSLYLVWSSHDSLDKIYYSKRTNTTSPATWSTPTLFRTRTTDTGYLHAAPVPDGIGLIYETSTSSQVYYDLIELERCAGASVAAYAIY